MSPWRKIVQFSLLRLLAFVVPFALFMILGLTWWVSALAATVVGFCISYLFLHKQRNQVSEAITELRSTSSKDADNDLENEILDREDEETKKR